MTTRLRHAPILHAPILMLPPLRGRALAALLLLLAACSPGDAVAPDRPSRPGVVLDADEATVLASLGDTAVVRARVVGSDGLPLAGVPVRWSVRPAGILEQDGAGIFRAVGDGRAFVVAEVDPGTTGVRPAGYWAGPAADTVVVTVRQRAVRLSLAAADTTFGALGAARQLHVVMVDARGHAVRGPLPPLVWASADAAVVAVDAGGVVRATGEGLARVTVQADALAGAATFVVRPRLPHTSCMVFTRRRQARQSCVTLDLVVRQREVAR